MKIAEIHIDSFGHWRGLRVPDLSTGVTVIHGPNEAGKSTLLQLIRAVLYGYSVANHQRLNIEEVFDLYQEKLMEIIAKIPRISSNINVLMHIYGYFSGNLKAVEKDHFFGSLDLYRNHQLPLVAVTSILQNWIERFDLDYLRKQTYFRPYPLHLVSSYDSAKGKMYY